MIKKKIITERREIASWTIPFSSGIMSSRRRLYCEWRASDVPHFTVAH
jgi:hypothetical protein